MGQRFTSLGGRAKQRLQGGESVPLESAAPLRKPPVPHTRRVSVTAVAEQTPMLTISEQSPPQAPKDADRPRRVKTPRRASVVPESSFNNWVHQHAMKEEEEKNQVSVAK